jgi:hypothetical protein
MMAYVIKPRIFDCVDIRGLEGGSVTAKPSLSLGTAPERERFRYS